MITLQISTHRQTDEPTQHDNSFDKQFRRAALCISYKANVIPPEAHSGLGITNYRSLFVLRTHR